jgi:glycerol-3-phosphate dehydrogenase
MGFEYSQSVLNADQRTEHLASLNSTSAERPLDLLVIGGGVVGLGSALDASSRGLKVGLVEKGDFASGTSSKSSRLAHGGLRYLEQFEFGLVHEALRERGLLLDVIAPHLTHPVEFIFPTTSRVKNVYNRFGVEIYYLLSRLGAYGGVLPRPGTISKKEFKQKFSALNKNRYNQAVTYYDAQIDDSRHTIALARTASGFGSYLVNYCKFLGFRKLEANGVIAVDIQTEAGNSIVYTNSLLFATGPWTDEIVNGSDVTVEPSKGAHIVVPKSVINLEGALISRTDKSVLFILPWDNTWIIGTTDNPYSGKIDNIDVSEAEVEMILNEANSVLAININRSDVVASFAGIRPLASPKRNIDTAKVSREHQIEKVEERVFSVIGGKYTTYRVMAKDAIDQIVKSLATTSAPCMTQDIALVGARSKSELPSDNSGVLYRHYGDEAKIIRDMIKEKPALGELLHISTTYTEAEVHFAVKYQGARTVDDVLSRRLRLTTLDESIANEVEAKVARILQES